MQPAPLNPNAWSLLDDGWALLTPDQQWVLLSASERLLLQLLTSRVNQIVSREALATAVALIHTDPDAAHRYQPRRVNMLVSRMRAKVRQTGHELPLHCVPRRGYVLRLGHAKAPEPCGAGA